MITRAVCELEDAMIEYILQSQLWNRCDPENFDNARKKILLALDRVIAEKQKNRRVGCGYRITWAEQRRQYARAIQRYAQHQRPQKS
jgi:hypothetical protein